MITPEPALDIYTIVLLTGIIQGALLCLLLFRRGKINQANVFLGFLTLALTLSLTEIFLNHTGLMLATLYLYNFSESLQFLIGPLLFLYVKELSGRYFRSRSLLHFLLFGMYTLYLLFEFTAQVIQKYINYIAGYFPHSPFLYVENPVNLDPLNIRRVFTTAVIYFHLGIYILLAVFPLRKALMDRDVPSRKQWILHLALATLVGVILFPVSKKVFSFSAGENIVGVYLTFFIYLIVYFLVKDSPFFRTDRKKYGASSLTDEWANSKLTKLQQLMAEEKPYLSNTLSLRELAEKVGMSEHHLSQLLNQYLQTNFFGFINKLRATEAKRYLEDTRFDHLKIEEIGYKVGYNSKSAFFAAFKKTFQTTPQAYRTRIQTGSDR